MILAHRLRITVKPKTKLILFKQRVSSSVLPPRTDRAIVNYYADLFARAINTQEYQEWMDQNLVFVDSRELDPDGLRQHAQELRRTFLPLANQINPAE